MRHKPFILGLTGNIASGKTFVLQWLAKHGAITIDADLVAQQSYLPGNPAYEAIIARFGEQIKQADGQIDRAALAKIVFSDPAQLRALEAIVHPATTGAINARIAEESQKPDVRLIVIEAIKLFETGMAQHCNTTWVTTADDETRLGRLIQGRGMDPTSAAKRLNSQGPQEEKARLADFVITTDGSFEGTEEQIKAGLQKAGLTLT